MVFDFLKVGERGYIGGDFDGEGGRKDGVTGVKHTILANIFNDVVGAGAECAAGGGNANDFAGNAAAADGGDRVGGFKEIKRPVGNDVDVGNAGDSVTA